MEIPAAMFSDPNKKSGGIFTKKTIENDLLEEVKGIALAKGKFSPGEPVIEFGGRNGQGELDG